MENKQKRLKSKSRKETEAIEEHEKQLVKSNVVAIQVGCISFNKQTLHDLQKKIRESFC